MKKIRNFNNRVFRFIEELIFDHHWDDDIGMMRRGDIRTEALWFLLILLAIIVLRFKSYPKHTVFSSTKIVCLTFYV